MATIQAVLKTVSLEREDVSAGKGGADRSAATDTCIAFAVFTMPAFGAIDTGQLQAVAAAIQAKRRDQKTVTLRSACRGEAAFQASFATSFYTASESVSGSNINFSMTNRSGTSIGSNGNGVGAMGADRPFVLVVAYDAS